MGVVNGVRPLKDLPLWDDIPIVLKNRQMSTTCSKREVSTIAWNSWATKDPSPNNH
jgi:hypothetical protein